MPDPKSPWKVTTTDGALVVYCDTEAEAIGSAGERNVRAEQMGIVARYVAAPNQ